MNSECTLSKFALAQGHTHMIGQNVLLFIQVKMHVEGILEDTIIVVFLVQSLEKVHAEEVIHVNMHTEYLNAGCTLLNIALGCARMEKNAIEEYAFSHML